MNEGGRCCFLYTGWQHYNPTIDFTFGLLPDIGMDYIDRPIFSPPCHPGTSDYGTTEGEHSASLTGDNALWLHPHRNLTLASSLTSPPQRSPGLHMRSARSTARQWDWEMWGQIFSNHQWNWKGTGAACQRMELSLLSFLPSCLPSILTEEQIWYWGNSNLTTSVVG